MRTKALDSPSDSDKVSNSSCCCRRSGAQQLPQEPKYRQTMASGWLLNDYDMATVSVDTADAANSPSVLPVITNSIEEI